MGFYSSFVVKIWVDDDGRMRRGYVQHVGTQDGAHFLTLDKMHSFMMNHLLEAPSSPGVRIETPAAQGPEADIFNEQVR
jgi:hypothetical protein